MKLTRSEEKENNILTNLLSKYRKELRYEKNLISQDISYPENKKILLEDKITLINGILYLNKEHYGKRS